MKKYISIAIGMMLVMGITATVSAQVIVTCSFVKGKKVCTQSGDGGGGSDVRYCRFPNSTTPYRYISTGSVCYYGNDGEGHNIINYGIDEAECIKRACGGYKSAALSFGSIAASPAARGSSSAVNPSPALGSRAAALRDAVAARSAKRPASPAERPNNAPSTVAPVAVVVADNAAYTSPTRRADFYAAPLPHYYPQWAKPTLKTCYGNTPEVCRGAATEVQGNSMGTPKNTCQWLDYLPVGKQCATVQLP